MSLFSQCLLNAPKVNIQTYIDPDFSGNVITRQGNIDIVLWIAKFSVNPKDHEGLDLKNKYPINYKRADMNPTHTQQELETNGCS